MDIHRKSVDMDMDVKFHIHGNPGHIGYIFVADSIGVELLTEYRGSAASIFSAILSATKM